MTDMSHKAQQAGSRAGNSEWFDKAIRAGLVAYGVVHLLIGWLALQLALGDNEGKASSKGAMQQLAEQPFGTVLLWLVALGMLILVAWRLLEAAMGHQDEDGGKLWAKRGMDVLKAVLYAAIGISAIRVAMGSGSSGSTESTTAKVMNVTGGQLLIGLLGLAVMGYGANLVRQAYTEKFREKIHAPAGDEGKAYVYFGKAGYTAKGVAIAIIGGLFVYAAATHTARRSGGLDEALHTVLEQPLGPVLLGLIAVGIICYGLFSFARAKYLAR
jgi:hypothetical protein